MDPYAAPSAVLEDPLPRGRVTAVVVGAAVGSGVSYAVLFVSCQVFLWILAAQGVPTQALYAQVCESTPYLVFAQSLGFLCLVPGGYWSARFCSTSPVRTALLSGCLVAAFALLSNLMPYELPTPLWSRIASAVLPVPAFCLGALWWQGTAGSLSRSGR